VKLLGPDQARTLLTILELPDEEQLAFVSSMYQREDAQALAEILTDIEEDFSGRTRERLIEGLHAALDWAKTSQGGPHRIRESARNDGNDAYRCDMRTAGQRTNRGMVAGRRIGQNRTSNPQAAGSNPARRAGTPQVEACFQIAATSPPPSPIHR
jgi:hypothetical protein